MFIVPSETPGVNILRNVGIGDESDEEGDPRLHPLRERAGADGPRARAARAPRFAIAQTRLGGGRIHHAMRTVASVPAGAST